MSLGRLVPTFFVCREGYVDKDFTFLGCLEVDKTLFMERVYVYVSLSDLPQGLGVKKASSLPENFVEN